MSERDKVEQGSDPRAKVPALPPAFYLVQFALGVIGLCAGVLVVEYVARAYNWKLTLFDAALVGGIIAITLTILHKRWARH